MDIIFRYLSTFLPSLFYLNPNSNIQIYLYLFVCHLNVYHTQCTFGTFTKKICRKHIKGSKNFIEWYKT